MPRWLFWMMVLVVLGVLIEHALAEERALTPNWCAEALSYNADPKAVMDFRRLCTIQRLDEARAAAADALVQQQVDAAVEGARLKALTQELALSREKLKTWCDVAAKLRPNTVPKPYGKFVGDACPKPAKPEPATHPGVAPGGK